MGIFKVSLLAIATLVLLPKAHSGTVRTQILIKQVPRTLYTARTPTFSSQLLTKYNILRVRDFEHKSYYSCAR